MVDVVLALMLILGIGFLGTWVAAKFRVPHSVFLVVFGVAAGMLIRGHAASSGGFVLYLTHSFPELVLYVLLPPLIFESAYHLDYDQLKRELYPLGVLSVVALIVSTLLVGYGLHWIFHLELLPSLVFGALISATDPVAVVALFKEVGAPARLNTLIEGESLLNDGTAIVLYRALLAATAARYVGGNLLLQGGLQFLAVSFGGAAVGLLAGWITSVLLQLTSKFTASQLGVTVISAYLSFIVADHYLGASGVISTLVLGLYLGRRARLELNREAYEGMRYIWEFLSLSANTLVFLAVGLAVDPSLLLGNISVIPLTVGIVYLARAFSVFTTIPAVNALRLARPISLTYQTVLFWGGLRGGLALGLVLLLPEGFPHKQLFVALAIAVVLSTLLINALTTKTALRILKLDRLDQAEENFYEKTLELAQKSAFEPLLSAASSGSLSPTLVEDQRSRAIALLTGDRKPHPGRREDDRDTSRFSVSSLLLNERRHYDLRLQDGILSREAYVELNQLVATRFEAFTQNGLDGLKQFRFELGSVHDNSLLQGLLRKLGRHHSGRLLRRLTVRLEVLLHLKFALEEAVAAPHSAPVDALAGKWLQDVDQELQNFYRAYPHYGTAVQSFFIADTIRARSRKLIQQLFDASIISGAVRAKAENQVRVAHELAASEAGLLMRPTRAYLVGRVPIFKELPKIAIKKIAEFSKIVLLEPGDIVFREGEAGHSFFLVAAGLLEIKHARIASSESLPHLFTGDFFGEMSLLFSQPRLATITAIMTTELLELDQRTFEFILSEYPSLKAGICETAMKRMNELQLGTPRP